MVPEVWNKAIPRLKYEVDKKIYKLLYCLEDGIYTNWGVFIDTLTEYFFTKEKTFSRAQETICERILVIGF